MSEPVLYYFGEFIVRKICHIAHYVVEKIFQIEISKFERKSGNSECIRPEFFDFYTEFFDIFKFSFKEHRFERR